MSEWMDIETAPKDGTQIIGFGKPYIYMVQFSDKWKTWVDWHDGDPCPDNPPTHWMPLPTPPA